MSTVNPEPALILPAAEVPDDIAWLAAQARPVIAYGEHSAAMAADVVVSDSNKAEQLAQRTAAVPLAALVLVQVLRATETLPVQQALDVESMAYSMLQSGPHFKGWLTRRESLPRTDSSDGNPILLTRSKEQVHATLNRAENRNAMTVEMRDAWVEALLLLGADDSIATLNFSAAGACFSVGGDVEEFGTSPDAVSAHWVRTVQSPARLLARYGKRVRMQLHGACIGSGIELPAFAGQVLAARNSFFQLPELQMGLIPGAGGTVGIARRIGRQRMAEWVISGRRIRAQQALEWGLIDELTD